MFIPSSLSYLYLVLIKLFERRISVKDVDKLVIFVWVTKKFLSNVFLNVQCNYIWAKIEEKKQAKIIVLWKSSFLNESIKTEYNNSALMQKIAQYTLFIRKSIKTYSAFGTCF